MTTSIVARNGLGGRTAGCYRLKHTTPEHHAKNIVPLDKDAYAIVENLRVTPFSDHYA